MSLGSAWPHPGYEPACMNGGDALSTACPLGSLTYKLKGSKDHKERGVASLSGPQRANLEGSFSANDQRFQACPANREEKLQGEACSLRFLYQKGLNASFSCKCLRICCYQQVAKSAMCKNVQMCVCFQDIHFDRYCKT
eukprot:1160197-Pelagomonas_calceolata.AAC.1